MMTTWFVFRLLSGSYIYAPEEMYPWGRYSPFRGLLPIYKIRVTMK